MDNQIQPNSEANEKALDEAFEIMRRKKAETNAADVPSKTPSGFKALPDGTYTGQVFIKCNTVSNEKSPNYGLMKNQFEFTVNEGEFKGKMTYFHCVIIEHHLATAPPKTDAARFAKWQASAILSWEKADKFLELCGVDTSDTDRAMLVQRIAENNRRRPIINFTVKNGTPHVNYLISSNARTEAADSLFSAEEALSGNDAPLV